MGPADVADPEVFRLGRPLNGPPSRTSQYCTTAAAPVSRRFHSSSNELEIGILRTVACRRKFVIPRNQSSRDIENRGFSREINYHKKPVVLRYEKPWPVVGNQISWDMKNRGLSQEIGYHTNSVVLLGIRKIMACLEKTKGSLFHENLLGDIQEFALRSI